MYSRLVEKGPNIFIHIPDLEKTLAKVTLRYSSHWIFMMVPVPKFHSDNKAVSMILTIHKCSKLMKTDKK